jgi:hypothetical protein
VKEANLKKRYIKKIRDCQDSGGGSDEQEDHRGFLGQLNYS